MGLQEDTRIIDPDVLYMEFVQMRIISAGKEAANVGIGEKRIAINDFIQNENRNENSLKFLPIWIEAFMLTSLSGTFGPVLKRDTRKSLSDLLRAKIKETKSDFSTY